MAVGSSTACTRKRGPLTLHPVLIWRSKSVSDVGSHSPVLFPPPSVSPEGASHTLRAGQKPCHPTKMGTSDCRGHPQWWKHPGGSAVEG